MELGMLWFDGESQRPLQERLDRAARYYAQKYGRAANTCYVHPSTIGGVGGAAESRPSKREQCIAGLTVRASRTVLTNHFWLGVEEQVPVLPIGAPRGVKSTVQVAG
jgi:hypothetical protein